MSDMSMGAKARLELARDILKIRTSAEQAKDIAAKYLASNRISSIRRVLLGRDGDLLDELLSPAVGGAKLQKLIDDAEVLPVVERVSSITYANALSTGLAALASAEGRRGVDSERGSFSSIATQFDPQEADALVDAQIERGRIPEELKAQLPALKEIADKASAAFAIDLLEQFAPDVKKAKEAAAAESERLTDAWRANDKIIQAIIRNTEELNEDEQAEKYKAADAKRKADYAVYSEHFDKVLKPASEAVIAAVKRAREKLQEPLIEAGKAFTQSVLEASPVSKEEATAWAEAQDITPQARARLKKIGYPVENLVKDMAEFYRFSGGRVVKVKVHSKGDKRANATNIDSHGTEGVIHLDSAFDKRVLWHELAHHIEADPVAKMAAGRMIRRRSVDGKAYSLRSLTGHKGYRSDEAAYKDHFFNHYVGKIYRDGITEVFSMGVESFSNPLTLAQRMIQDPETLEFVAGYLKQPIHPLAKAHMGLRGRVIDMNSDVKEESGNVVEQLQKQLAAMAELVPSSNTPWHPDDLVYGFGVMRSYIKEGKPLYAVGGTNIRVMSVKVRNPETGRQVSGLAMLWPEKTGEDSFGRVSWDVGGHAYPTKDVEIVKVAAGIWQKTGRIPSWGELNNEGELRKHL